MHHHTTRPIHLGLLAAIAFAPLAFTGAPAAADTPAPGSRASAPRHTTAPTPKNQRARSAASTASGLRMMANHRGKISRSIAAASDRATGLTITKPDGARVRAAYLATATTGYTGARLTSGVSLAGHTIGAANEQANLIGSFNYFADVTGVVTPVVDAAPAGAVTISYAEPDPSVVDGSILVVVFDDPAQRADQSVTLLYGALAPQGDTYGVTLDRLIDTSDPTSRLEMSLGISYSYQLNGTQQFSLIDVNGARLTSSAGGEDDGYAENGGLITVGGDGDDLANPADPQAAPTQARSDDELYDLKPFVTSGERTVTVKTLNPSNDDNVLLATFTMNPPVSAVDDSDPALTHTITFDGAGRAKVGTDYTVTGQLVTRAGTPEPEAVVRLTIRGTHAESVDVRTDKDGRFTHTWRGTQPGIDIIDACYAAGHEDGQCVGRASTSVTWERDVVPQLPPLVDAGPRRLGADGKPVQLKGTATDPNGDHVTTYWTIYADKNGTPGPIADDCTVADRWALETSVTCTRGGRYHVALDGTDGHHSPAARAVTPMTIISAGGAYTGPVNRPIQLRGVVGSPKDPAVHTHWMAYRTVAGKVGTGAHDVCGFSDVYAATPTLSCTEAGLYRVYFRATDKVNATVESWSNVSVEPGEAQR